MKYLLIASYLALAVMLFVACARKKVVGETSSHGGVDVEAEKKAFEPLIPKYTRREATPQQVKTPHIAPLFWWVGMNNPMLEIVIHDNMIGNSQVNIQHPGVTVKKVNTLENPNYLFIELNIAPTAKVGTFPIRLTTKSGQTKEYTYELKAREKSPNRVQGLSPKDVIYLIMPDRFAKGDPKSGVVEGMHQTTIDRTKVLQRHGGDLQGIINKLDYLANLGITAIWLNPVLENDEPYESYHGYAVTDHYAIDRRMGSNETYKKLVDECHKRGIKVIKDIVQNHCGHEHWFIKDLPSKDWINQWDEFTRTTYRASVHHDPNASESDKKRMVEGWFDFHMPDLNQRNPHVANFLNQYTIWWIEYTGLDGFRIDTYAYPDIDYSKKWMERLEQEYPQLGLFGETWVDAVPIQNYFIEKTGVNGITDFQWYYAVNDALNNEQGWTSGVAKIYYTLAQDNEYKAPYQNVIFLDNHDLSRLATNVGGDMNKFKSGLSLLLTSRGIPCMYYGTEIMLGGSGGGFGEGGRQDFPGGWADDKVDKFKPEGRTPAERESFDFIQKLLQYRKANPVLSDGKMTQFVPEEGIYVYFRHNDQKTVMVIFNSNNSDKEVTFARYAERFSGFTSARNIITNEKITKLDKVNLTKNSTIILELQP